MIEANGATRHIYTAAAVAVRHEMTPDTLATRQDDTAVGGGGGGALEKNKKQKQPLVQVLLFMKINVHFISL